MRLNKLVYDILLQFPGIVVMYWNCLIAGKCIFLIDTLIIRRNAVGSEVIILHGIKIQDTVQRIGDQIESADRNAGKILILGGVSDLLKLCVCKSPCQIRIFSFLDRCPELYQEVGSFLDLPEIDSQFLRRQGRIKSLFCIFCNLNALTITLHGDLTTSSGICLEDHILGQRLICSDPIFFPESICLWQIKIQNSCLHTSVASPVCLIVEQESNFFIICLDPGLFFLGEGDTGDRTPEQTLGIPGVVFSVFLIWLQPCCGFDEMLDHHAADCCGLRTSSALL